MAFEMSENGNYDRSLELLKRAVENFPENTYEKIQALRQLGGFYCKMAQTYPSKKQVYKKLCEATYDQAISVWDKSEVDYHK